MSDLEKKKDLSEKIYNHRGYIHACASQYERGGAPKRTVLSHSHRFDGCGTPLRNKAQKISRQSLSVLSWRCARKTHTSSLPAPLFPVPCRLLLTLAALLLYQPSSVRVRQAKMSEARAGLGGVQPCVVASLRLYLSLCEKCC